MNGAAAIATERARQISGEGYDAERDDAYTHRELVRAGECYEHFAVVQIKAAPVRVRTLAVPPWWPWRAEWWKPADNPRRNLEKAGALYTAELERLLRQPATRPILWRAAETLCARVQECAAAIDRLDRHTPSRVAFLPSDMQAPAAPILPSAIGGIEP